MELRPTDIPKLCRLLKPAFRLAEPLRPGFALRGRRLAGVRLTMAKLYSSCGRIVSCRRSRCKTAFETGRRWAPRCRSVAKANHRCLCVDAEAGRHHVSFTSVEMPPAVNRGPPTSSSQRRLNIQIPTSPHRLEGDVPLVAAQGRYARRRHACRK